MKKRTKIILILASLPLFFIVLYNLGLYVYLTEFCFPKWQEEANERRSILLYKTDHAALLDGCRKLIKESREGKWPENLYSVNFRPHPDSAKLPETILQLNPTVVFIENDRVMVAMSGGLDHFGVHYFCEGFSEAEQKKWGGKKLLDGLWYYDDGYRKATNPEQYLESLRPE
ncbi:MAG: hypothetical protein ACYS1A_00630 [Planctomycetota bacterium]|jgi:hypothetical protein